MMGALRLCCFGVSVDPAADEDESSAVHPESYLSSVELQDAIEDRGYEIDERISELDIICIKIIVDAMQEWGGRHDYTIPGANYVQGDFEWRCDPPCIYIHKHVEDGGGRLHFVALVKEGRLRVFRAIDQHSWRELGNNSVYSSIPGVKGHMRRVAAVL